MKRVLVSLAVAGLFLACSSIPELTFVSDDGGTTQPGDGGPTYDVITPEGGCEPKEVCDDGLDNDCNGKSDCADLACAGFACTAAPPQGWTVVAFSPTGREPCAAGATAADVDVVEGDGAVTCSAVCNGGCANTVIVTTYTAAACGGTAATANVPINGNCTALAANLNVPAGGTGRVTVPTPTACTPTVTKNAATLTHGRVCSSRPGTGCASGMICAPVGAGTNACVMQAGQTACPAGFPRRFRVGATSDDTRTCSNAVCSATPACTGATVSVYDNNMCQTNGAGKKGASVDASCSNLAPDSGFTATYFKSTPPTGSCSVTTQPAASGAIAFTDERTVCCK